jgi:nucleoside-diphosphate-sugar epimerase
MKILVTGDQGYIGSVLTQELQSKGYEVAGYDIGYYSDCKLYDYNENYPRIQKDIRDVTLKDVQGFDAIIHLAALSNDPLGELSSGQLAKQAGIKRFVYSSSQSMYGISDVDSELDEDNSEKNPITAYARTKWEAECQLKKLNDNSFSVICFRPSTVFGASPRLRCDIVYNNLVACAFTTGKIEIKSDGTPWRPVVHVKDVCAAYIAGLEAPLDLVAGQSFNVGIPNGNFTVADLARAAQRSVPGSELIFTGEHNKDVRTYRVGFNKILTKLEHYYKPEWDLDRGGKELMDLFSKVNFTEEHFRGRTCTRLAQLKYLQAEDYLNHELRKSRVFA